MSQDPAGFAAGDDNLYRYVGNNTPNFVDPTGLYAVRNGATVTYQGPQVRSGAAEWSYDKVNPFWLPDLGSVASQRLTSYTPVGSVYTIQGTPASGLPSVYVGSATEISSRLLRDGVINTSHPATELLVDAYTRVDAKRVFAESNRVQDFWDAQRAKWVVETATLRELVGAPSSGVALPPKSLDGAAVLNQRWPLNAKFDAHAATYAPIVGAQGPVATGGPGLTAAAFHSFGAG